MVINLAVFHEITSVFFCYLDVNLFTLKDLFINSPSKGCFLLLRMLHTAVAR